MFVAESVLSDVHVNDAIIGIQLVNSPLVVRNCTMNSGGGVQLTGNKPVSLTLDHASFSARFGNTVSASTLNALDLSVTNSRLSAYESATKVRCYGHLSIRITNSTVNSVRDKAVDAGGDVIRATVAAENSIFTGQVQIDHFTSALRHVVCLFAAFCESSGHLESRDCFGS